MPHQRPHPPAARGERLTGLLLLLFLLASIPAHATLVLLEPVEHAARAADRILVADVDHLSTELHHGAVHTRAWLTPILDLDDPPLTTPLSVLTPGGRHGDIATRVAGSPQLSPGSRVLLLLDRGNDGEWRIRGLALGHFVFHTHDDGRTAVLRDLRGLGILPPADPTHPGHDAHQHADADAPAAFWWHELEPVLRAARTSRPQPGDDHPPHAPHDNAPQPEQVAPTAPPTSAPPADDPRPTPPGPLTP